MSSVYIIISAIALLNLQSLITLSLFLREHKMLVRYPLLPTSGYYCYPHFVNHFGFGTAALEFSTASTEGDVELEKS